jgi:hypothetical protein
MMKYPTESSGISIEIKGGFLGTVGFEQAKPTNATMTNNPEH